MEILNLDLNELERSASTYLKHIEGGLDQVNSVPRSVMDGIMPILEIISSGMSQALFDRAMDARNPCTAALLCEPPAIGISLPGRPTGELIKAYDASHPGKGFRAVCIALSEYKNPLIVADILSREVKAGGPYGPSILVKNGIHAISIALARASLDSDSPGEEHRFALQVFKDDEPGQSGAFTHLADFIRQEMFSAHLNEGRFYKTKAFIELIESLGSESNGQAQAVAAFKQAAIKEIEKSSQDNVELLIRLLMTTDTPSLDPYRLAAIKVIDESLELDDYLKGSFALVNSHRGIGNYIKNLGDVYVECGYDALTAGIRDAADWNSLSEFPGIDMNKISVKDIPRQARGAALEHGLGL